MHLENIQFHYLEFTSLLDLQRCCAKNKMQTKGELMFGLGLGELLIILFVVLMLFGGKRLPLLGSALGRSIQNFKNGLKNSTIEDETKK